MESRTNLKKFSKGTVTVENFRDRLRLRWRVNGLRYSLTLGLKDTTENRKLAEQKAHQIKLDIQADCFDETLSKYKLQRHLSIVNPT
ncbi:MAG: DUF3596 domain-containing protein [Rhizonema sp. PD38]|nr:DUF3596 domain-containing protein [Rhizonema sp. PD38]